MSQPIQETLVLCNLDFIANGPEYHMQSSDKTVLELFCREGGKLSFLTRHAPWELSGLLEKVRLTTPVICCDGAVIYDPTRNAALHTACLNEQEAAKLVRDLIFRFPGVSAEITCRDNRIYIPRNNRLSARHMERYNLPFQVLPLEEIPHGWVSVMIRAEKEQMEEIYNHIRRKYYGAGNYFHAVDQTGIVVLGVDAHREAALIQLQQLLGISQESCVLLAENEVDANLLPMVGNLVCGPDTQGTLGEASSVRTMCALDQGGLGEYLYGLIREQG